MHYARKKFMIYVAKVNKFNPCVNCFGGNSTQSRYQLTQLTFGWNFSTNTTVYSTRWIIFHIIIGIWAENNLIATIHNLWTKRNW